MPNSAPREHVALRYADWRPGRDYQLVESAGAGAFLFVVGNSRLFGVSRDLAGRLRHGLDALTTDEAAEWNRLADADALSTENAAGALAAGPEDGSTLAINVNLTSVCNLGCTYCFADGGDYGRLKGKLDAPIADDIFRFVRENAQRGQTVRLEFFGGEPLLNFERIQAMCAEAERVTRDAGIAFIFRVSTNLTLLPPGAPELFARHRFIVSVSIDGGRETHDRNRPTKGGRGSWDKIMANCRTVRAASDEVTLVARMTVLGGSPSLIENVRQLWDTNLFDYFQIYPGVVPRGALFDAGNTMAEDYIPQLLELMRHYPALFAAGNRFKGVLEYERIADMILAGKTALSFCSGGRNYFTFSPDKSVMPCHRLVGDETMQVGDSQNGLTASLDAWRLPVDRHPVCSGCWVRYICGGGCRQENLQATGNLNTPSSEGCRQQITLVEQVIGLLGGENRSYRGRDRGRLDDLFVSCGRPLIENGRREVPPQAASTHFHPV